MTTYAKKHLMKRIVSLFFLLFLSVSQLFSQVPKSSLLWQISGNGLKQPSYLFGTFHMICRQDFEISDVLKNKFRSTKQFYAEVKIDDPTLRDQLTAQMAMNGKTIRSFMTEVEYRQVSDSFRKITGIPFTMFNNFKPFMSMGVLTLGSLPCEDKIRPEFEFVKLANEYHLPILGLETVEDEVSALNKQPLDSQVNSLKESILHFDSIKTIMKQLISIYKTRDIDSVYRFMSSRTTVITDDFVNDLVIARNKNWLPVITKAVKEKPSFFAVGAGHLGGKEGVISLLRTQGYKVTPVQF
jgi:uncharacterized protein YbaP (TraB family)